MAKSMNNQQNQGNRINIAVLIGRMNLYTDLICFGMAEYAKQKDINLIILGGKQLVFGPESKYSPNIIYQLANGDQISGIVVLASYVGQLVSPEEMTAFCNQFSPTPLVIIGEEIEGFSSISVDNHKGLYDLICHLIDTHDRHRIAFIHGPTNSNEAIARYDTYRRVLRDRGIAFNPDLVVPGGFQYRFGQLAIEELLQRGVDFDAVIGASDAAAWGALDTLRKRGVHVPYDTAVIGFDDYAESRYTIPPLSTVRQPRRELGIQAIELILEQINGIGKLRHHTLMTEMVLRQSCGCLAPTIKHIQKLQTGTKRSISKTADKNELIARQDIIREGFWQTLAEDPTNDLPLIQENIASIFDAFYEDIVYGNTGEFLRVFDQMLQQAVEKGENFDSYHRALLALRAQVMRHLNADSEIAEQLENSWQQARITLGNVIQYAQYYRYLTQLRTEMLFEINEDVITTFDLPKLMHALVVSFQQLDIHYGYLCLNDDSDGTKGVEILPAWSRLILAYVDGEVLQLEPGGVRFPTGQILPEGSVPKHQRFAFYVFPLRFQDYYLGHAVFEVDRRLEFIYEALQIQISGAVQGALLIDKLSQARDELEHRVEERTAELQKEISERIRVEETLRENEQRYRALFEQTSDAVFIVSLDGKHLAVNQKAADMLGYTVDEMIGMSANQVVAPDEFDNAMEKLASVKQGITLPIYERNLIRKDGSIVPVEINLALVNDDTETPIHIQSVIRDITKRKRSERIWQTLNIANLAMRNALTPGEIFEAVGTEFKNLGFECTVFRTNLDLSEMHPHYFSYDHKAISSALKLMNIDLEKFTIKIKDVEIFQKTIWEQETVFVNDAGEVIRQLLPSELKKFSHQLIQILRVPQSINAPLIVDNKVMGMLSVQSNNLTEEDIPTITAFSHQMAAAWQKARLMEELEASLAEQIRTEESLRESEGKFRSLFELSPEAMVLVGLNGIILDANQAIENISGLKKYKIIGQSFLELGFWNEDQQMMPGYNELFAQAISGELTGSVELQLKTRHGKTLWIELHPAVLKGNTEILALQLIIRDITNQKMAELAVQQRVNELEAIYQTSIQLANASLQVDEIGKIAVQMLRSILNVDECSLSILDKQKRTLSVIADMWSENGGQVFLNQEEIISLVDYPLTAQVLETMRPVTIQASDVDADPAELAYMKKNGTATLAIIPLVTQNRAIGTMELETWEERSYTTSQLNLAMTLANQIAVALDNARLYEAAQQELIERLQAEMALQESEEQFRSIFENAVMGLYRTSPDGKILMANPALIRMLGFSSFDELIRRDLEINGFSSDHPRHEFRKQIDQEGQIISMESAWKRLDGSLLYVQENARAIYDNAGKIVYYEGTVEDITHRKQVEALQRISEERFNKAFNISPLTMGIQGLEGEKRGVWLLINDAFCQTTGYTREEVIGHSAEELQLYARKDQNAQAAKTFLEQGYLDEFEFVFRKKSGELRDGLLWSQSIQVGSEKNVLIVVQDITERKQIEKERQELIEFQQIVAGLSTRFINLETTEIELEIEQALGIISAYAGADACSVWIFDTVKSTIRKTFNWSSSQEDNDYLEIPLDRFPWLFSKLLNAEEVYITKKQEIPMDANDLHLLFDNYNLEAVLAIPLISEGQVLGSISFYMREVEKAWAEGLEPLLKIIGDIIINALERKRAEESIRRLNEELELRVAQRTQQLEAANTELEAFAYSVSHDLRAPLRAINGFSLALQDDYGDQLDQTAKDYLQRSRAASQRMGQLIDDLLKLSRITRSDMLFEPVNLSSLAIEIIREMQEAEPERVVEFNVQPDLVVLGDVHLLRIALVNLLSNAWKFSRKKITAKIEFGCITGEKQPVFFVRDNGAGFEMNYSDKLFGTFQRLHTTRDFEGTGIGLATVKRIILRHGGSVWAEGQVDQGATFYFTIGELH